MLKLLDADSAESVTTTARPLYSVNEVLVLGLFLEVDLVFVAGDLDSIGGLSVELIDHVASGCILHEVYVKVPVRAAFPLVFGSVEDVCLHALEVGAPQLGRAVS